ncbi:MAG: TlpA disulfide reductase family protein [Pseudomonadota bacterium]
MQNRRNSLFLLAAGVAALALPAVAAEYRLTGKSAPDFALRSSAGTNIRLSEHRGEVVLLAFFGSRCDQCGDQLAVLSRMFNTYKSAGLVALAVNVDDDQAKAAKFIAAHQASFPMLLDPEKTVARSYRVDNLPMLLLVDRAGVIRYAYRDFHSRDEAGYLAQTRQLLDE